MNIAVDLDRNAEVRPDHPALVFDDDQWSYAELDLHASHIATGLEAVGVRPGDRVALFLQNWPEHVATWYGIAKAGAVAVDVNILLGDEEWSHILGDSRPSAIVCGHELAERVAKIAANLAQPPPVWVARGDGSVGTALEEVGAGTGRRPAVDRADDDLAVIAYTSGTTGLPKGVMHAHGLLRFQLETVTECFDYRAEDLVANLLPLFPLHAFLCQAGISVHNGSTLLLLGRFDPAVLARVSRTQPITAATFVPAIVIGLLQMPDDARPVFAAGRSFNIGGAALHPEVRDRFEQAFGVTLLQGFGSTEVMGAVAMEKAEARAPWGSCGSVWPGAESLVRVVDDRGTEVAPGAVGEFAVHKSRATIGYWENPSLTAESFIDGEWFRMGDLGRIDEAGFVYLLDRKKDIVIRGGFNIYSAEIERVLNEHPAVAEATVVGIPHERLGEVPRAYIVLRPDAEASHALADELKTSATERLGSLKAPEEIVFVAFEALPRNAMGKVLKRELRGSPAAD